jgi:hypothetical protein
VKLVSASQLLWLGYHCAGDRLVGESFPTRTLDNVSRAALVVTTEVVLVFLASRGIASYVHNVELSASSGGSPVAKNPARGTETNRNKTQHECAEGPDGVERKKFTHLFIRSFVHSGRAYLTSTLCQERSHISGDG